jgi:GNAT superfamily N-acetyltransferase
MPGDLRVRPSGRHDRAWLDAFWASLGGPFVARRGELVRVTDHPTLIAERGGDQVGLVSYIVDGTACEILTLHANEQWRGIGTALVEAVRSTARAAGCRTLWVLTTNDNVDALRFYQRRGFRMRALRPGAVDEARRTLKPWIPDTGEHGIALRDEIELELAL